MKYICPLCKKNIIDHPQQCCGESESQHSCNRKDQWFFQLKGKGLWRIRYINKFEFQFFTDEDFLTLQTIGHIILDDASHWKDFDPNSYTGLNEIGQRTSIFDQ